MLNQPTYYHATTKKAILVFGNLFNNLSLERRDATGTVVQTIKVPLSYAPKMKYLAREVQEPDIDGKMVGVTLPRMAFEITGLTYDSSRKLNSNTRNTNLKDGKYIRQYTPVPYNLQVELYLYVKNQEDGLQIIEQILPTFTPQYTVTINAIDEMDITHDLPIILNHVSFEDNYDGDFSERREIVWTLSFTLQMNYFGATDNSESGIIKHTDVTFYNDVGLTGKAGHQAYEVSPLDANKDQPHTILETIEGW